MAMLPHPTEKEAESPAPDWGSSNLRGPLSGVRVLT